MVEVYDPQVDSWQRVASMPRGLYRHAAAAMDGKIYVTGGETDQDGLGAPARAGCGASVNSAYVYDPQADAWTQLASMGTARKDHATASVGGKLYVFGGYGPGGAGVEDDEDDVDDEDDEDDWHIKLSTAEVYDPASDNWTPVSSLTSKRCSMVAIAL